MADEGFNGRMLTAGKSRIGERWPWRVAQKASFREKLSQRMALCAQAARSAQRFPRIFALLAKGPLTVSAVIVQSAHL